MTLKKLSRVLRTVRHLRPAQLYWYIARRVLPQPRYRPVPREPRRRALTLTDLPRVQQPETADGELEFLGVRVAAPPGQTDWHPAGQSKLWCYNLHYHDFLLWDALTNAEKLAYIDDWIASNPVGTVDAWEPYTVSLRVVNWIKFYIRSGLEPSEEQLESLLNQGNWLAANLEYHILANHYLKNGKALIWVGACFAGRTGAKLLKRGLEVFLSEVDEQFLADGAHYERTFMYHGICVEDLLDVVNLLRAAPELASPNVIDALAKRASVGLDFLADTLAGDGGIALFNDGAFGIAPEPAELLAYGERLLGRDLVLAEDVLINRPESGYFGYRKGGDSLLIDCGEMGPAYQLGHGHCDLLSYELTLGGERIIVDAGVYAYENGEMRDYVRSTRAHNTVAIDGADQAEVWGGFRVADRAHPVGPDFTETADGLLFSGAHNGYRRLPGRPVHLRQIATDRDSWWSVADEITGEGEHEAASYVHCHPDITLESCADGSYRLRTQAGLELLLSIDEGAEVTLEDGWYCPRFGVRKANKVLKIKKEGVLPLSLGYRLERGA